VIDSEPGPHDDAAVAVASERDQRLFVALVALRDAAQKTGPATDRHWRVVYDWLEATFVPRRADDSELTQRAVLRVMDAVGGLEATSPRAAARWLGTIRKRIAMDASRTRIRARERQVGIGSRVGEVELVDEGPRPDEGGGRGDAHARLEALEESLRDRIGTLVDARTQDARKRVGDRLRADAAIARAVHRRGEAEIRDALGAAAPPSRDALYKWVERGRELVLATLDAWAAEPGLSPEQLELLAVYRGILAGRRVDAGKARPARRGPRQSGNALHVLSADNEPDSRPPSRREGRS